MSLIYDDGLAALYHADCLTDPGWLEEGEVLVTDPPYGIDYRSNKHATEMARSIAGDKDTTARDTVLEMWDGRPALVFGTWRIPHPNGTRQKLIWDTKGALGMGAMDLPWKPSHQEIYVIGKGFTGHRDSDVITVAPVQSLGYNGRVHPHQKPIALMERLIDKCPPGVIVDPFAGSGSTLVAAKKLGRRAIGVEQDAAYCELIIQRLEQGSLDFEGAAS